MSYLAFSRFIWIPVLFVYSHYNYFHSYSAEIDFRRLILTNKVDPRAVMVKPWIALQARWSNLSNF